MFKKIKPNFLLYSTVILLFTNIKSGFSQNIDSVINSAISPISGFISSTVFYSVELFGANIPLILVWLILGSLFCTFYFKFISITGFKTGIDIIRGKHKEPNAPGEVTHSQALWTACAATVGLGNIAGVAIAVSIGGPGATFWMIVAGLLGMSLKFCECTLGVKYRIINKDGSVSGGPMYYLSSGLKEKGFPKTGRILAILFSICCIGGALGGGNMFQANQSFALFLNITGGESSIFWNKGWLYGLLLALPLGFVIIGGIKSIAKVTEKLVPIMALIYILAALIILILNISLIPDAIKLIINGAFSPTGVLGGMVGVLIQGFKRAAFSNEAGLGSAPIAHSAVKTNYPVTEGYVSLLEPFIDTVVICTLTALVIIITGMYSSPDLANSLSSSNWKEAVVLTSDAFGSVISWFPYLLTIAVILFAFSTMISWSYYGLKAWTYLFGENKLYKNIFNLIFCIFVIIGSSMSLGPVIDISDSMIFAMSLFNIIGVYFLASVVRKELKEYRRLRLSE